MTEFRYGILSLPIITDDDAEDLASSRTVRGFRRAFCQQLSIVTTGKLTSYDTPIILSQMVLKNILRPKFLVGILFTVMALVAFNLSRPSLSSNRQDAFNEWYEATAPKLGPQVEPQESDLPLSVVVTLKDPTRGEAPTIWHLPSQSLRDPSERDNTGRVLQLIRESGVFGMRPLGNPSGTIPAILITIRDGERQFETAIPLQTARDNIQLMNLLKLIDIYANPPKSNDVTPERL